MVNVPCRLGVKINTDDCYYDDQAELNYKTKRNKLMKHVKLQAIKDEEDKNDGSPSSPSKAKDEKLAQKRIEKQVSGIDSSENQSPALI